MENEKVQETNHVALITKEIRSQLASPEIVKALMATTFKGLSEPVARQALFDGMLQGFTFQNFLIKDIYAIPFASGYSLITSIGYARKIGMRSGVVGVSKAEYEYDDNGKIIDCTITVKRKIGTYIGEFTATVDFKEYNTGKNQWVTKPKTMIAKVAEMHALRKACPEEMSRLYSEEEMEKEVINAGKYTNAHDQVGSSGLTMRNFTKNHEETTIQIDEEDNESSDSHTEENGKAK